MPFKIIYISTENNFCDVRRMALVRDMQRACARIDDKMMAGCARGWIGWRCAIGILSS